MNISMQKNNLNREKKLNSFERLLGMFALKEKTQVIINEMESDEILQCIRSAKSEWQETSANFEYVESEELVDYYTYKLKACEIRYEYYLKKAKEKGISADVIDRCGLLTCELTRGSLS